MTNTLGGGGDFNHFMDHLGPALKTWLGDMRQHEFEMDSQEKVNDLKRMVNEWIVQADLEKIERDRDAFLSDLVRKKSDASI